MKIISKLSLVLCCLYFVLIGCGQNNEQDNSAKTINITPPASELFDYDFSEIFMNQDTYYLGYIGNNFERLCINYNKVDKLSLTEYYVEGETKVKSNICNFIGKITIKHIEEFKELHLGVDDFMHNKVYKEGVLITECILKEDSLQKGSGLFQGILTSKWYLDNEKRIYYDDIEIDADSYSNNQFEGSWTSYRTKVQKPCAWGHYRIPNSEDLDIGAGEFAVNPKYKNNGWLATNCYFGQRLKSMNNIWKGKYYYEAYNKDNARTSFDIKINDLNNIHLIIITNDGNPKKYNRVATIINEGKIMITYDDNQIMYLVKETDNYYTISGNPIYFINPGSDNMPLKKVE